MLLFPSGMLGQQVGCVREAPCTTSQRQFWVTRQASEGGQVSNTIKRCQARKPNHAVLLEREIIGQFTATDRRCCCSRVAFCGRIRRLLRRERAPATRKCGVCRCRSDGPTSPATAVGIRAVEARLPLSAISASHRQPSWRSSVVRPARRVSSALIRGSQPGAERTRTARASLGRRAHAPGRRRAD